MTESSERLKIKRSTLRTAVTKLLNKIEEEILKPKVNLDELEVDLEQLAYKGESLRCADEAFQNTLKTEELEKEFEAAELYQENIIRARYNASKCIRSRSGKLAPVPVSSTIVDKCKEECAEKVNNLRLPKLEIAKFDGKLETWAQFWSQYESAIHDNNSLNKISKFNYLKMLLTNSPLFSIEGLVVTEENYDIAINILKEKYDQKDIAIGSHMKKLLQLNSVKRSSNIPDLRNFYEKCMIHVRSLEALGVELKSYGNLLFPVIAQSIPEDIMLDFNRKKVQKEDQWDISKLLGFVREEIEYRERTYMYKKGIEDETNNRSIKQYENIKGNLQRKNYSAAGLLVKNYPNQNLKCNFCNESHWSASCKNSLCIPLTERKQLLIKRGCCFICLKPGHVASRCSSSVKCNKCFRRHYSIMCPQSDIQQKNMKTELEQKGETHRQNTKPEVEDKGCVLANQNQTCSSQVLMQTLTVKIYGKKKDCIIRALIDTGSQKSYITQNMADTLEVYKHKNDYIKNILLLWEV